MSARLTRLRAEHRRDGLGVATPAPRLSWRLESDGTDLVQDAVELRATTVNGTTATGWVPTADQVLVEWPFAPIRSREQVEVSARARLSDGAETEWSAPLALEGALYEPQDWSVDFVSPSESAPAAGVRPGYLLRAAFNVPEGTTRLRAHVTAHGIYQLELDGRRVGDEELAPGWTSYRHRLRTRTIALPPTSGSHALGAELTDGWYRGRIGFHGGIWDNYGDDLALLVQLEATVDGGETVAVPLDWRVLDDGPVVAASLYDGEHYDARRVPAGWSTADFDDTGWRDAVPLPRRSFGAVLEPAIGEPVRVVETLAPISVEHRPNGRIRLDFGQNISGRLRIRVTGEAGHAVTMHHAEVLEHDELAIRPLRSAPSVDRYVLRGDGPEVWSPRFTIHGFRYAELEGWPGEFSAEHVDALVVHTDMERTGWFESDHPLVNRLHENTVWSMRDNFVDLPTDCPQRDERLGWTGDIQVFAPAATTLFDCGGVLASWLVDLEAEQSADGHVPNFVPWLECGFPEPASAAWGDAAVIVPWTMFQRRGDVGVLRRQLPSMIAWVDHFAAKTDDRGVIADGMQLGDWLDPAAPPEDPGAGLTDKYLVATAYLAHSARLLERAATVLGETAVAQHAAMIADRTREGFRAVHYADGTGLDTPTAAALAITFDLLEDGEERSAAGVRLAALVREGGHRVQTGFVGTPIICDALASTGHLDVAYRLIDERDCPSWLYPVTMGATTIWERWDSMLPDGTVNPGEMTSFNHYALGAVVDFLYRSVGGIVPVEAGYRSVRIAPRPGELFGSASTRVVTPYGEIATTWAQVDGELVLEATLPVGVRGELVWPDGGVEPIGSGSHRRVRRR